MLETYNMTMARPYELPLHKTKMVIRSQTHKGHGFNELSFEDEAGKEEIFIHGEKNERIVINNDKDQDIGNDESHRIGNNHTHAVVQNQFMSVGGNRQRAVAGNETVSVNKDQNIRIQGNSFDSIGENHTLTIAKDEQINIGRSKSEKVDKNRYVEVDGDMVFDAQKSITLKCGNSQIQLMPDGKIIIKGDDIEISGSNLARLIAKDVRIN